MDWDIAPCQALANLQSLREEKRGKTLFGNFPELKMMPGLFQAGPFFLLLPPPTPVSPFHSIM